jgi:tRNA threonylcarbamoyladenosine biosynthesis protein TsaE
MIDKVLLRTAAETATEAAGSSLASSIHKIPVTIGLSGHLGAGKTAFMRGFLRGLGFNGSVASPTYALEQRYATVRGDVVHIDLYRLEPAEVAALLRESDGHEGIRCVEWPEKAGEALRCDIAVQIAEERGGTRTIDITLDDVAIPSDELIAAWRTELRLPKNVAKHCDVVGEACRLFAEAIAARGIVVRPNLARAAGLTHDLLRFVDFHPGAAPAGHVDPPEDRAAWDAWKSAHPVCSTHEEAAAAFLEEHGYPELGRVACEHSIRFAPDARESVESRILYYADKRVIGDGIVTLAQRFSDFTTRYRNGVQTPENARWEQEASDTEKLLFPDGPPF